MPHLSPANTQFAIMSFEGPDEYSRAGGLAVRVRDLATSLAEQGFLTHLFFVGDPSLPGTEQVGCLILHRWCQWISAYHPGGVYDGEMDKMEDLTRSLPPYLLTDVVVRGAEEGKVTVLMGEDWQTVGAMIYASALLAQYGLSRRVVPVWTANNVFGFGGIN